MIMHLWLLSIKGNPMLSEPITNVIIIPSTFMWEKPAYYKTREENYRDAL